MKHQSSLIGDTCQQEMQYFQMLSSHSVTGLLSAVHGSVDQLPVKNVPRTEKANQLKRSLDN